MFRFSIRPISMFIALVLFLASNSASAYQKTIRVKTTTRSGKAKTVQLSTPKWSASWTASPSAVYSATTSGSPTAISPTFECRGEQYTSGTGWPCTNWSFTSGTVTKVATPFYPSSWSTNATTPRLATSSAFTGPTASPGWATDFTIWALFKNLNANAGSKYLMYKSLTLVDFALQSSVNTLYFDVYNASSAITTFPIGTLSAGAWYAVACSYHAVADGTSVGLCNTNGTAYSTSSLKLARDQANGKFKLDSNESFHYGYVFGGLDGTAYNADQLAALTRSLRGLMPTTGNSAIAFTRSSVASCQPTSTSGIFYMGPNFPCITENGIRSYKANTNLALYSQALDNAAWTKTGTGTTAPEVTADQYVPPDAVDQTGDKVAFHETPDATDIGVVTSTAKITLSNTPATLSLWARSNSGATTIRLGWRHDADSTKCSTSTCTLTTTWKRCTHTATPTADDYVIQLGTDRTCDDSETDLGENEVGIWGVQLEQEPKAGPYIVTTTTATAGTAEEISYTSQLATGSKCYSVKVGSGVTAGQEAAGVVPLFAHSAYTGANNAGLQITGGNASWAVADSAATVDTTTTTGTVVAGATWKVCTNNVDGYKIGLGNTAQTISTSGTGTGIQSAVPATVYLGEDASGGNKLNGYIQSFTECNGYDFATCAP